MYLQLSDVESKCNFSQIKTQLLFTVVPLSVIFFLSEHKCSSNKPHSYFVLQTALVSSLLVFYGWFVPVTHILQEIIIRSGNLFDSDSVIMMWHIVKVQHATIINPTHNTTPAQRWALSATCPWDVDMLMYFHVTRSFGLLGVRKQTSGNTILHRHIKWYDVQLYAWTSSDNKFI